MREAVSVQAVSQGFKRRGWPTNGVARERDRHRIAARRALVEQLYPRLSMKAIAAKLGVSVARIHEGVHRESS